MKIPSILLLLSIVALTPVGAQSTSSTAGYVAAAAPTAKAPIWLKMVGVDNVITCYYGTGVTQPKTWTQVGKPVGISFQNNPVLAGIFITSHNASSISSGTIDNFSITPTAAYRLVDSDIGAPAYMGSANLINGVWNIAGSGADIWGTSDQFNFQPWLVYGDSTAICRVTSLSSGNPWQKIGIMVRDGYNSGSDYAMICATQSEGVNFQCRTNFNNNKDMTELVAPTIPGVLSSISIGYSSTGSTAYVVRP